jgi:hypothetical protein
VVLSLRTHTERLANPYTQSLFRGRFFESKNLERAVVGGDLAEAAIIGQHSGYVGVPIPCPVRDPPGAREGGHRGRLWCHRGGRDCGLRRDRCRLFKWLIEEQRDDRGNVVTYEYKAGDDADVDPGAPQHQNRIGTPYAQRYLKRANRVAGVVGNLYRYCHNNPVTLSDAGGQDPKDKNEAARRRISPRSRAAEPA